MGRIGRGGQGGVGGIGGQARLKIAQLNFEFSNSGFEFLNASITLQTTLAGNDFHE
jgi:hypothetical protein